MSHFTKVKTEISDKECLIAALTSDVGGFKKANVEVHDDAESIGDGRKAHIIVRNKNIPGSYKNLGFEFVDGRYEVHGDFSMGMTSKSWLDRMTQDYAERVVMKKARRAGFLVVGREKVDGKIKIRLRRPA